MTLIHTKVDDTKTAKVFLVDITFYCLRPMAIIGSKTKNPPIRVMGDFISFENFRITDPQKAHDKIPQSYYSSKSTGHNSRKSLSTPTSFDTAFCFKSNIEPPEREGSSFIIPLPTTINP